ncbi:MAG: tetratricopeptide repeat protein, partial [Bdellovibrionales bacterium]
MNRFISLSILVLNVFSPPAVGQSPKPIVQAEIGSVADTTHVEFKGLKNWRYDLEKSSAKSVRLVVPALDNASIARLQSFSDNFISRVEVQQNGPDGQHVVEFTLASPEVESFDYLTDQPSLLIVDFYRKSEPKAAADAKKETKKSQKAKSGKKKNKVANPDGYVKVDRGGRAPAGSELLEVQAPDSKKDVSLYFGIFDGSDEDYDRFRIKDYEIKEEAMISSRNNIYLPFPMLKIKSTMLDRLMEQQPEYVIHPKDTRENKEARLLLTLFQRKRFGVFLKTYDYFMKKYPESDYAEILKNLSAQVHLERWMETKKASEFDQARALYGEMVQKISGSPLREHNYLILGFSQLERGEALTTLQTLQGFLTAYPKSPEVPEVRKAVAEAFMLLRRYDEATEELNRVIKDFPGTQHAREARYRLGDVQFAKGDYARAITAYEAAIKTLPDDEKVFPNADYNMAESRFWQKDYRNALDNYVRFINHFPTHSHGGYALTRIGELLGIMGADPRRVMGAFLESYFRFPDDPGAKVARIRMLSQQMRGMKPKELSKAVDEIKKYGETVDLPGMDEFTTLMVAEGLSSRGEYKSALANLIAHYQKNPASANLATFKSRILRNIANELKGSVEDNKFMEALDFNSKYAKTWLKNSDRIDVPYFVGEAFERAGAFDEAEKIYTNALQDRKRIAGTVEEKERRVQEHLPSLESLHLRLAQVEAQNRNYMDAYQHLKEVGEGRELSPTENIERVELSAKIAEQRGDWKKARDALLELSKRWQGDAGQLAPVNLHLAKVELKLGDSKAAATYAKRAIAAEGNEVAVPDQVLAESYQVLGDALLKQEKGLAAVESFQKLLERFEEKMPLASVR